MPVQPSRIPDRSCLHFQLRPPASSTTAMHTSANGIVDYRKNIDVEGYRWQPTSTATISDGDQLQTQDQQPTRGVRTANHLLTTYRDRTPLIARDHCCWLFCFHSRLVLRKRLRIRIATDFSRVTHSAMPPVPTAVRFTQSLHATFPLFSHSTASRH